MSYWLIAVPNEKPPRDALKTLQENTRGVSSSSEFAIPPLKVGTLDSLMALSEELAKFDPILETLSKKIERTYFEISSQAEENSQASSSSSSISVPAASSSSVVGRRQEPESLRMGEVTTKEYVEKFKWNDFRYNSRTALKALSDGIIKEALKLDETLKKQLADYNETRSSYAQIERVETGTLLVRPLAPYVKAEHVVEGEFITTLLVVVPRAKAEEFEQTYGQLEVLKEKELKEQAERLAKERSENQGNSSREDEDKEKEIVIPRRHSATGEDKPKKEEEKKEKVYKDGRTPEVEKMLSKGCPIAVPKSAKKLYDAAGGGEEFVLYRVVVLKKGAEYYKSLLRDRRCTVRPFKYEPEEETKKGELKQELQKKKRNQWLYLQRWCNTSYVEAMVGWLHLKAIRLFVEAVLRYGLPVDFRCILIDPQRNEKKLRATLKQLYGKLAAQNLTAALDPNEVDPSGLGDDFYPYVYLPLNILE